MSINKFELMVETAKRIVEEKKNAHYEAQDIAKHAEKAYEDAEIELRKLEQLEKMAKWSGEVKACEWYLQDTIKDGRDFAWRNIYRLKTVEYEFVISITERTDLKKFKYVVKVRGSQQHYSRYEWQGGYNDHQYVEKKYTTSGIPLEHKFTTLKDALKFMSEWQSRLTIDHHEVIDREFNLIKTIKASK